MIITSSIHQVIRQVTILLAAVGLLMAPQPVHARSYIFLREAIREYSSNPNPETEVRLHTAQRKAMVIDASVWAIPVLLVIYVFVRVKTGSSKS